MKFYIKHNHSFFYKIVLILILIIIYPLGSKISIFDACMKDSTPLITSVNSINLFFPKI